MDELKWTSVYKRSPLSERQWHHGSTDGQFREMYPEYSGLDEKYSYLG